MNPLELQRETWDIVMELYSDMRKVQIRSEEKTRKDRWKEDMRKRGVKVRRATDTSGWW